MRAGRTRAQNGVEDETIPGWMLPEGKYGKFGNRPFPDKVDMVLVKRLKGGSIVWRWSVSNTNNALSTAREQWALIFRFLGVLTRSRPSARTTLTFAREALAHAATAASV